MIPDETNQERRDAAIKRSRRIDALAPEWHKSALHRIAAFDPSCVDRALGEIEANTRPSHPLRFYADDLDGRCGLVAICAPCDWTTRLDDGHSLADLERLVAEHPGIEQP